MLLQGVENSAMDLVKPGGDNSLWYIYVKGLDGVSRMSNQGNGLRKKTGETIPMKLRWMKLYIRKSWLGINVLFLLYSVRRLNTFIIADFTQDYLPLTLKKTHTVQYIC